MTSPTPPPDPEAGRRRVWLGLILLVGLAARVGGTIYAGGLGAPPKAGSDQSEYDVYAWNLARGNGYRGATPDVADPDHLTAYRPPVPSVVMAAVYVVAGHEYAPVRLLHCLLSTLSVYFTYRIGRRVYGESVGLLAAAGYALYPVALLQAGDLMSEPTGVLLFLVFLDRALALAEGGGWPAAVAAGVALGLALLARANYAPMVPLFALWALVQFRRGWRDLLRAVAVLVVAGLVMAPWVVRNYQVFGKLVPFSTTGGSALLQGNNPLVVTDPKLYGYSEWDTVLGEKYRDAAAAGRITPDPAVAAELDRWAAEIKSGGDELERDRRAGEIAVRWLKDHPDRWAFLVGQKFLRSWTPVLADNPSAAVRWAYLLTWGPVLVLFAVALIPTFFGALRTGSPAWLLHLAVLHYVANSVIFFANIRYRAPIDPVCFVLAAWTLRRAYLWWRPAAPSA